MDADSATGSGSAPGGSWSGRNVLVTGSQGFLGSWLSLSLCDRGARVFGLARREPASSGLFCVLGLRDRVVTEKGDLEDYSSLERILSERPIDFIFHLAAQPLVHVATKFPRKTFETNVRGTWNLLEAVRSSGRRIPAVVASSESVYRDGTGRSTTEESPLTGRSPYDVSKICAELMARVYHDNYECPIAITRFSNLYGGGDLNFQRIIPGAIRSILNGAPPVIRGDGRAIRDFLYVQDAVEAYLALAENVHRAEVSGEAFNFSSGHPARVIEIVETILRLMNRPDLAPRVLNEIGDLPWKSLGSRKASEVLGWKARYSLETGLAETTEWYRAHASVMAENGGNSS